jgi:hypothetical protein
MPTRPRAHHSSVTASPSIERLRHQAERLSQRAHRHRLKPAKLIRDNEIKDLLHAIETVPVPRRLPPDVLSQLRSLLKKVAKRLRYIEQWKTRYAAKFNVIQWQRNAGAKLAQTRDLNAQLAWLLNRQHRNRNLYAMAQGKRTSLTLGSAHMAAVGRQGAMRRWHPERLEQLVMWQVGADFQP